MNVAVFKLRSAAASFMVLGLTMPAHASTAAPAPREAAIESSAGGLAPTAAANANKVMCVSLERPGTMIDKKICKSRQDWIDMGAELRKKKQ